VKSETEQFNPALLAAVWRGDIRESEHRASVAAVNDSGELLFHAGNPDSVTSLRSAAKPLQAIPLLTLPGSPANELRDEELAICCASHPGLPRHAALAASVLALSGFLPDDLVCGPSGNPPSPLRHGCSGNHACILLVSHSLGAPLSGYEKPQHPAQRAILRTLQDVSATSNILSGMDGCGIPTFGLKMRDIARTFASLTHSGAPWERIPRVMAANPELIGDEAWIDVRLMQATSGRLVAKTGADGLLCIGVPGEGMGMAVKVMDGSTRALGLFTLAALQQAGWITEPELMSPLLALFRNPTILASTGEAAAHVRLA
jgi:L-asparaginase